MYVEKVRVKPIRIILIGDITHIFWLLDRYGGIFYSLEKAVEEAMCIYQDKLDLEILRENFK